MYPCVVIPNSCESITPEQVIKEILEVEGLPEPLIPIPEVRGYPWHIVTKYYEADVHICSLDRKSIGTQGFADSVNALVLPFNSLSDDGLKIADQWATFTNEFEAEVKILLCDQCAPDEPQIISSGISKLQAQTWCVENGFELVELNPVIENEDSDLEDDFPESTGIKRVIQALHAHMWPNLVLKDRGNRLPPLAGLQTVLNGLDSNSSNYSEGRESKRNGDSVTVEPCYGRLVAEVKPIPKESPRLPSNVAVVSPTVVTSSIDVSPSSSSDSPIQVTEANVSNSVKSVPKPSPTRDERIDVMLEAMDSMPEESFEELFQNLNAMKSKAESLSPSQRKVYAEKMAVAFWKSIGGNDSEVEGISSEED